MDALAPSRPYRLLIAGDWHEAKTGKTFQTINPADESVITEVAEAGAEDLEAAVVAARQALESGPWPKMSAAERGRILWRMGDKIGEQVSRLALLETLDTGKPVSETRVADWASGADALEWFAGLAAGLAGEAIDLGGDFVYTRREPLGVCLGIGAWNYPSQIACWKAAPAPGSSWWIPSPPALPCWPTTSTAVPAHATSASASGPSWT